MRKSPTKEVFRLINESRSYCIRLAIGALGHHGEGKADRQGFGEILETIAKELQEKHELEGYISYGSLRSNQWRFGKWKKLPTTEYTATAYFQTRADEEKNGTINPDELEYQRIKKEQHERFAMNRHKMGSPRKTPRRKTTSATGKAGIIINKSTSFKRRLCQAAGPEATDRKSFQTELELIVKDIQRTGEYHIFTGTLGANQFKFGHWRELAYVTMNPIKTSDDMMDAMRWQYMNFPPHGKSVTANQHMLNEFCGKTADYIIIDDKIADAPSMDPKLLEYARKQLHKTKLSMDFAALEERVAIETGCTPKELVNQTNRSVTCPAALGLAYGGARSARWNVGCYAKREHSLFAYQTDIMKQMLKYKAPKPQPKEEVPMKIVNQTLINDRPLDTYSNSELIDNISRLEGKNKELEKLETKSEHISDQIETNTLNCKKLAGFLDSRTD